MILLSHISCVKLLRIWVNTGCVFVLSKLIWQLDEDQEFKEFLSVHQRRDQAPTWANDTVQTSAAVDVQLKSQRKKKDVSDDYLNFDSDDSDVGEEEDEQDDKDDDEGW